MTLAAARGVRLVSLMHVGGDGWLKTLDFVPRSEEHLRDILSGGERADGSSLFAGLGIEVGRLGHPAAAARRDRVPRSVRRRCPRWCCCAATPAATARRCRSRPTPSCAAPASGSCASWASSCTRSARSSTSSAGARARSDVYGADDRGYHATSPFVFGEALRRDALALLAEIGVPVKYGHSEVGYVQAAEADGFIWEQHEIELALAPLPDAADAVVLTQWVLRNLAHRDGMRCSFDPILRRGHAGTGLHFHFSPVVDGEHLGGRDADGRARAAPAQWLIAGLVRMGGALMAFGNRTEGSLVRLTQAKEAPNAIVWGEFDRSALVRLPIVATTEDGRPVSPPTIEFRLPDGSAHPHLLLAGVAQAMVEARASADLDGAARAHVGDGAQARSRDGHAGADAVPRGGGGAQDRPRRARGRRGLPAGAARPVDRAAAGVVARARADRRPARAP